MGYNSIRDKEYSDGTWLLRIWAIIVSDKEYAVMGHDYWVYGL